MVEIPPKVGKALRLKRVIRWVAAGCIILSMSVGTLVVYSFVRGNSVFLTASSPAGIYKVSLSGQKDRPLLPVLDHSVRLSVLKDGTPFLLDKRLHEGDWLDASFGELYPQYEWVGEQSLQFYRPQYRLELPYDIVTVTNNSSKRVGYLKVISIDMIIMLDIDSQSTSKFLVSRGRWDQKWTSVEGEFVGGNRIPSRGASFDISRRSAPFSYQITISDTGSTIEGP